MKSSLYFVAALLAVVSIILSSVSDAQKDGVAVVREEQLSSQFLNYVGALNDLYLTGNASDGDVKSRISLPAWLPKSDSISLRISGGVGYVFMPSSPGVYSQLLQSTENSAHIGLSDVAVIHTPAGQLIRPDFIPSGYVVYVR